jgi:hypothetical protein
MSRLREWATVEKFGAIAEVLFKIAALVAALAAANFFFFRPDVELDTHVQPFIDLKVLDASYAAEKRRTPAVVTAVANEYNRRNREDLRTGRNSTAGDIPAATLCQSMRKLVEDVFPKTNCSRTVVSLGRGRYYERLLLTRNATQKQRLGAAGLRDAINSLAIAEYRKARCFTKNVGHAKAANVQIRVADGFRRPADLANDPFSLQPNESFDVTFETARGFDEDPKKIQFGVDFERAGLADSTLAVWVAGALLFVFILVLLNDLARSPSGKRGG